MKKIAINNEIMLKIFENDLNIAVNNDQICYINAPWLIYARTRCEIFLIGFV